MLKRLKFVGALIDEEISSDLFYSNVCNVRIGRLESLCLADFGIEDADDSIKKTNLLFNIILNSCPNLKTIKLEDMGDINARGNINLHFRKNQFLQHIELDMSNCRFYTFYHEFGKRWRRVGDQITMEDVIL